MSQNDIDAAFDDIEDAFDQLEDQGNLQEEQPAVEETEPQQDVDCPMADADHELAEEEECPPESEVEAEVAPVVAEAEATEPPAEPETTPTPEPVSKEETTEATTPPAAASEPETTEAPVSKEETTEDAKPARKRPTFKKPAAKKVVAEGTSEAVDKEKASAGSGTNKVSEEDSENKADNEQATGAAPDAATDGEKSEEKKPEKAPVKSKKIPVPRRRQAAAAPPDPCNYTAPKEDDEDDEKPAKKATKAAGKKPKPDGPKLPSAKTAYFIFTAEQRGPLKSENADLSFGEINKKLGEMWSGLSEDEKKPYMEQVEEDKARVEKLIQADPALLALRDEKSSGKKRANATKAKEPKTDKSPGVAANKVLKTGKKVVKKASKKKSPAVADDDSSDPADAENPAADSDESAKVESKDDDSKGRASKRKANRAIRNEEKEESDEEYDWEADHEDCDWAAHPAECIVAVTNKQKYVVKRKGLPFHDYGLVPVNAAKRHCSGQEAGSSEPINLTAEMINEFEAYRKGFSNETVDHTTSRELDLEDLEDGSKLEMCAFLGDLRREGVLTKPNKKTWTFDESPAQFPIMSLSFVVQRVVHAAEVSATTPLHRRIKELETENAKLKAEREVGEA